MTPRYEVKTRETEIISAEVVMGYDFDQPFLDFVVELSNGYKKKYPLTETKDIKSKSSAVIKIFKLLEVKRSSELPRKKLRLLDLREKDKEWLTLGIGHPIKD